MNYLIKNNSTLLYHISEENTIKNRFFWKKIEKKIKITFYCETEETDADAVIRISQAEMKMIKDFKTKSNF